MKLKFGFLIVWRVLQRKSTNLSAQTWGEHIYIIITNDFLAPIRTIRFFFSNMQPQLEACVRVWLSLSRASYPIDLALFRLLPVRRRDACLRTGNPDNEKPSHHACRFSTAAVYVFVSTVPLLTNRLLVNLIYVLVLCVDHATCLFSICATKCSWL